ncbi:MAG TPA: hypothetical protein DCE42_25020 [Myxococcales bacterium]|nr:hypothetical protein [Deltaproteobacteria bacterium]HAA58048.1 hypothetical protein [Myxococcales bacterium]
MSTPAKWTALSLTHTIQLSVPVFPSWERWEPLIQADIDTTYKRPAWSEYMPFTTNVTLAPTEWSNYEVESDEDSDDT